jgi:hypothetical protein
VSGCGTGAQCGDGARQLVQGFDHGDLVQRFSHAQRIIPPTSRQLATVIVALLTMTVTAPAAVAEPGAPTPMFPVFTHESILFDHDRLAYNPTGEWDFPTVIRVEELFDEPLGAYYLYTAPHNSPGGISLFYADSPAGPWLEYPANPVVPAIWEPHHTANHVSSPHVLWIEDEDGAGRLWLYYHGNNATTRYATSDDGITFDYGGVAVTAAQAGDGATEASYARVFEHTIPNRNNRFTMLFMDAVPGDGLGNSTRRIRLATSDDAASWQVDPSPIVTPIEVEGTSISGPTYFPWQGGDYVVYHGASGSIFVTDVGENFDREIHLGALYRPPPTAPHNGRAAAPVFLSEGDTLHMFYEVGRRGATTIARAVADLTAPGAIPDLGDPAPTDPVDEPPPAPEPEDPPAPDEPRFVDVSPRNSHYEDVHTIARLGLTNGCGTVSFCPDQHLTRAETATFLMRAIPLPGNRTTTRFADVRASSSHVPGIAAIDASGHTNGCGPDRYCPTRSLSRAEMATFLARVLDLPAATGSRFSDVRAGSTHAAGIEAIARAGITNGCGGGRYCPDRPVTRAEMASFLVRAFDLR